MSDTLDMIPGRSPEVTISREEYEQLQNDSALLNALIKRVGVDNWDGWEQAHRGADTITAPLTAALERKERLGYIDTNCTVKESYNPHQYTFTGLCTVTKLPYSVTIEADNLFKFRQSDDIMDTGLNVDDREFAISGISPTGWNELYKDAIPG